ncbi:MAG: NAD-dependent epimerase/dehydratase family protein, partial [Bacteroidota bacterium]
MMMDSTQAATGRILVVGALGQIGTELVHELNQRIGTDRVLASDLRPPAHYQGNFVALDVTDRQQLDEVVATHHVQEIYHLAAILSARGESNPTQAWDINLAGLLNVLEVARMRGVKRIFWPSSIAVFGPQSPKQVTPQDTVTDPNTVYGISKLAGERWCEYYHQKYGLDIRSIRYPGLIGYQSLPGGGTTDYAVEIFHAALKREVYTCFLRPGTKLPMMFMDDAIRATLKLMEAPSHRIRVRSSYNLQGLSFTPEEIVREIQKHVPGFSCKYEPDFRQKIADSWPASLDDTSAR